MIPYRRWPGSVRQQLAQALSAQFAGSALVLLAASLISVGAATAHGGGTPRLTNAQAGPYSVYAWTQPEPLRAGEVHLTISVTIPAADAAPNRQVETPITDADVAVTYTPLDRHSDPIQAATAAQDALGTVYYEADAVLPSSGRWQVEIVVDGQEGRGAAAFEVDVASARQVNIGMLAVVGIALVGALTAITLRAQRAPAHTTHSRSENQYKKPAMNRRVTAT